MQKNVFFNVQQAHMETLQLNNVSLIVQEFQHVLVDILAMIQQNYVYKNAQCNKIYMLTQLSKNVSQLVLDSIIIKTIRRCHV